MTPQQIIDAHLDTLDARLNVLADLIREHWEGRAGYTGAQAADRARLYVTHAATQIELAEAQLDLVVLVGEPRTYTFTPAL